jgi:hypothetical protein
MARMKPCGGHRERSERLERELQEGKLGTVLLDLRSGLLKIERSRRALTEYGLSQRRWLEIVKDIDPNLRFLVRPQVMDAIVVYLESVDGPVERTQLVNEMAARGVGTWERIRQIIRMNLQNGKLKLLAENKIGLPKKNSN